MSYIKYYTGLDALYIPAWCGGEPSAPRQPALSPVLVDSELAGGWSHPLMATLRAEMVKRATATAKVTELYPDRRPGDIQAHPSLVLIPSHVAGGRFVEYYRLNIPLFVPSIDLLLQWHRDHNLLQDRVMGHPQRVPSLGRLKSNLPDPNSEDPESVAYWLGLCEFYHFEHVIVFQSWEDLLHKLETTDLDQVRHQMAQHNLNEHNKLLTSWKSVLANVQKHRGDRARDMPKRFNQALEDLYGSPAPGPDIALQNQHPSVSRAVKQLGSHCPAVGGDDWCTCQDDTAWQTETCTFRGQAQPCVPKDWYWPSEGRSGLYCMDDEGGFIPKEGSALLLIALVLMLVVIVLLLVVVKARKLPLIWKASMKMNTN